MRDSQAVIRYNNGSVSNISDRDFQTSAMRQPTIQLCLVLHNHQPVGNFDNVFEAAYQDSYLPFLEVFEPFEHLRISLHTSGPLVQWLQANHPEYLGRVANLVEAGRIEIIGGAYYEPILAMIPQRDRIGQVSQFSKWLQDHVCSSVHGMWMPERVWESGLASSIADAGIQYTVLDDYHFRRAGLRNEQLNGYFIVEEEGRTLQVFPGSEQLRYLIPFAKPEQTIEHCRELAQGNPGCVVVFGDDGEKFGTWPDTQRHVYQDGWLKNFFQALTDNREWLQTSTLQQAVQTTEPCGKIYLPDASYREMTEWAQPVIRQTEHDDLVHSIDQHPQWKMIESFMAGGFWRNFKVKYPETNHMYARMMYVSGLLQQARDNGVNQQVIDAAQDHLYQGQCNCPYWHGAFGGIYLPHLRNAIYQHLINAETLLERAMGRAEKWVEATTADYLFDRRTETRLANEQLVAWISGSSGGQIYELDLRNIGHNLNASIARREELYHSKVRRGQPQGDQATASIHDRVVFKQADLDKQLHYDSRLRNSLIDHFWDEDVQLNAIACGEAMERGDFADGSYETRIRRNPDRIQVQMIRQGNAWGIPLTITKGVTLNAGSDELEIAYLIEGLPQDRALHFGIEFNFAGLPDGQDDRFYSSADGQVLGQMQSQLSLSDARSIQLTDGWLGLNIGLESDQVGGVFTYPVQTVSQSEAGFELVHQCVSVQPHWLIRGDANGNWATVMKLSLTTDATGEPTAGEEITNANSVD